MTDPSPLLDVMKTRATDFPAAAAAAALRSESLRDDATVDPLARALMASRG